MNLSTVVDTPIFMSGLSLSLHNRNSIFRHVGVNTNTVAAKFEHWNRKMAKRREKMKKEWKHRKWKRLRAKSIFNLHAIIFLSFIALSITLIVYLYSRASKSTPKSELKASEHLVQWNTSLFGITMRVRVIDIRWHGRGIAFRCSHTNPESDASEYRFFFLCSAKERSSLTIYPHAASQDASIIIIIETNWMMESSSSEIGGEQKKRRNNDRNGKHDLFAYLLVRILILLWHLPKPKHTIIKW